MDLFFYSYFGCGVVFWIFKQNSKVFFWLFLDNKQSSTRRPFVSLLSIMADSIKLFQYIQKFHRIIGIYSPQPHQKRYSTISKNAMLLACCVQVLLTSTASLLFETNTMFAFGFGFYTLIDMNNAIVIHSLFICQLEKTLKFIQNCERFITEKSEYQPNLSASTHENAQTHIISCCTTFLQDVIQSSHIEN